MLYPLKLILGGPVEFECAGIAVQPLRLAANHRMAKVAAIMTTTATAIPMEPEVEPAREKPLIKSADVGGLKQGRGREWMKNCQRA